jgi:protein arginine kinase
MPAELTRELLAVSQETPDHEVALLSRLRLVRNLREPFPTGMTPGERLLLRERLMAGLRGCASLDASRCLEAESLAEHELAFLAEASLSRDRIPPDPAGLGLAFGEDARLSILVAAEDHLVINCLRPGLALQDAWACVDAMDAALEERFEFAFSEEFGYLAASPRGAGTGLAAAVVIHLPALALAEELPKVLRGLGALHLSLAPLGGNGDETASGLLAVTNARTLGREEGEILASLSATVAKLQEFEARARERLLSEARSLLEDRVWTAYGQLRYARLMDGEKARELLGTLRLGCLAGVIQDITLQEVQAMWRLLQPGHLQAAEGRALDEDAAAELRAARLRDWLGDPREEDGAR